VDSGREGGDPRVGVKLDDPAGNCDGFYRGKRYFEVAKNHGVLVPPDHVVTVLSPTKTAVDRRAKTLAGAGRRR
jgi:dynactin complex subunit